MKDVPEEDHSVLRRRTAAAGQSLQEYLLARLRKDAETPTIEELFQRIEHHTGGEASLSDATRAVAEDKRMATAPGIACEVETLGLQ